MRREGEREIERKTVSGRRVKNDDHDNMNVTEIKESARVKDFST